MTASLLPELLQRALQSVNASSPLWLVGGAVRDYFLRRVSTDFDLVSDRDSLSLGRALADAWGGAYYTLDQDRETGRALITISDQKLRIDIAKVDDRGIESDLARRDFTVNALGVRTNDPGELIDPTGGLRDLKAGVLRACAEDSIAQDPVRAIRAARLASQLGFRVDPATLAQAREVVSLIGSVAGERRRDELFRILELARPASALRVLQHLDLLENLFLPNSHSDWLDDDQGLSLVEALVEILGLLAQAHDPDGPARLVLAEASLKLGRYRPYLIEHIGGTLAADRTRRELALLGALMHAGGRKGDQGADGGWPVAEQVADALRLSNRELTYLKALRSGTSLLDRTSSGGPSPAAIYRYFTELGSDGIDATMLWLAEGSAGRVPDQDAWQGRVAFVRGFLAAWYDGEGVDFSAPDLITGDDLIDELGVSPGPVVGDLLAEVREALAVGAIRERDQALEMARERLREFKSPELGGSQG